MKKAVILLSGGLDSATTLAFTKKEGYAPYALSFQYGQRHNIEIEFAKKTTELIGVTEHKIAKIDLRMFGASALTDNIEVPTDNYLNNKEIPITYVPARNTIFLSYALAYAEVVDAYDIFIGANITDYSGYPDCRPKYLEAFEKMANLATAKTTEGKGKIKIHAPLLNLSKSAIIKLGIDLGVDYSNTISCYNPLSNIPCGKCHSCQIRNKGFSENNLLDPLIIKE